MMITYLDDFWDNKLCQMVCDITHRRFNEICEAHPELLAQRENVVVWEQECPIKPRELRYLITLNEERIASFTVFEVWEGNRVTVSASPVEYYPRK